MTRSFFTVASVAKLAAVLAGRSQPLLYSSIVKLAQDYQQAGALPSHDASSGGGRIPRPVLMAALILGLLTVAIFARTWNDQMLYWDDDENVLQNPLVAMPVGAGLKQIFTAPFSTDYYPITYISLAVDHWVWHGQFFGYHLTQTLLQALNAFLVVLLVWRWTKIPEVALLAGAWFAWHPVQVETVAWVAERKNLLGACFFLLAWLAYLRIDESENNVPSTRWRLIALALFVLAVLAHALVIIMPALLLLYEVCLRREKFSRALRRTWLFFVPAGFAALMRILGHAQSGQLASPFRGLSEGILTMTKVVGEYLNTLFWPLRLNNHYTETVADSLVNRGVLVAFLWLAAWALLVWRCKMSRRWLVFGLGWFLICLAPVLEIVPHPTLRADRYLYLAALGVFLPVAQLLDNKRAILMVIGPFSCICLIGLTLQRIPDWHDPKTLWSDCVRKNPRSVVGYYSLAGCSLTERDLPMAVRYLKKTIELKPDFAEAHERLGGVYLLQDKNTEAREELQRALALNPQLTEASHNLMFLEQRHP